MRRSFVTKIKTAILCASFAILATPIAVQAETIRSFVADVNVGSSDEVFVQETIRYDFESLERHGIFREIPYSYKDAFGTKYSIRISVTSVTDENGTPYRYETSRSDGRLHLKIGDPDDTVTGEHAYVITYSVKRAIQWYDGEPELYWNVTGSEWQVGMESVTARVYGLPVSQEKARCFIGGYGSAEMERCRIEATTETSLAFQASTALDAYEGMSIVVRFPKGSIREPSGTEKALAFFADNWGFGLPLITLVVLIILFRRYGRDPRGRGTIIAEYEPPKGMSPALLGYLIDERVDARDVTAAILGLAVKGHVSIEHVEKNLARDTYRLTKRKGDGKNLTEFEHSLLEDLFEDGETVELAELKKTFPQKLETLKKLLYDEAKKLGYYAVSPHVAKGTSLVAGIVLVFAGFGLSGWNGSVGFGIILSGILALCFAPFMSRRTEKGALIRDHIRGFKEFLTVTEKDRLKFHNAPERKPEQFMAFLPFAVALAVEREWAKQFAAITIPQPDWYVGHWATFNAVVFASDVSGFSRAASAQALTAPASRSGSGFGGGGFSGGGFGGGGGGSW